MQKRTGRPPKSPEQRKKIQISVRVTSAMRDAISRAADSNGCSFATEVTNRLEASLGTSPYQKLLFGGARTHAFSLLLALSLKQLRILTGHAWHENRFTFEHAKAAAEYLFEKFRPPGDSVLPDDLPPGQPGQMRRVKVGVPWQETEFGREAAEELFSAIKAFSGEYGETRRKLVKLLPEQDQKRYQFDDNLYAALGQELMPLADRAKTRARSRKRIHR